MGQIIRSVSHDDDLHDTTNFDCDNPELNDWLTKFAVHARARRTANTYVWLENCGVIAYYALAAHLMIKEDLPALIAKKAPEFIPAVLLGKLALDRRYHGGGYGGRLLLDALARVLGASDGGVAARVVVVDAADDNVARFYRHHGFLDVQNATRRLVIPLKHVEATLAALDD